MPSMKKLSISRSKSKQVSPSPSRSEDSISCDRKKSKKPSLLFKKSSKNSKKQAKEVKELDDGKEVTVLDDSDATGRTSYSNFDEFTLEDGLFSCNIDETRRTNNRTKEDNTVKSRRGNRQGSWIDSTWDGGASFNLEDNESEEDDLDDSLYQLLDEEEDTPEQYKKLSLHNILVEEELSFQRSLVWNDDENE